MSEPKIEMTIPELQSILNKQKEIVIEKLLYCSSRYNNKSTESQLYSLDINKEKFQMEGMGANYPNDFNVLNKYMKK